MAKITIDEWRQFRDRERRALRSVHSSLRVTMSFVGAGTCEAGSYHLYDLTDDLAKVVAYLRARGLDAEADDEQVRIYHQRATTMADSKKRPVTERDLRAPEFRDCKPDDLEWRDDGKLVRKDRWERAIRSIAVALRENDKLKPGEYEVTDVVEAVQALVKAAVPT